MRQLTCSLPLCTVLLAPAAVGQVIAHERPSGSIDLIELASQGTGQLALAGLTLDPCTLVGYPAKDRLIVWFPRPGQVAGLPDHVMLPNGGSLWQARQGTDSLVLQVTASGQLRTLLRVPQASGGVDRRISVSPDGQHVVVSASDQAWLLDAANGGPAVSLTASLGALSIDESSLRVNHSMACFTADHVVYVSQGFNAAQPVSLPLLSEEEISEEIVMALWAPTVLVVAELEEDERRLFAVDGSGTVEVLTPMPTALPLPGLDENLGPFIAVSSDGQRVAWRTSGASEELYVMCLHGGASMHVTAAPDYPVYLDNIGVLSFGIPNRLCFFAGDRAISGITGGELMGAADMYVIVFNQSCGLSHRNVSGTSGSFVPPFDLPGSLTIEETLIDPTGQRFFVQQELPNDSHVLTTFPINSDPSQAGSRTTDLITGQEHFEYYPAGTSVVVLGEREQGQNEDVVLSLLPPFYGAKSECIELGVRPEGTVAAQLVHHGTSAFVRLEHQGTPEIRWIDLAEGTVGPVIPQTIGGSMSFARSATFDHFGHLLLGATPQGGKWRWLRVTEPLKAHRLGVRSTGGFALPY